MSDIVTRLRVHPIPGTRPPIYGALRNEAADEIDRLRAENAALLETAKMRLREVGEYAAKVDALRERVANLESAIDSRDRALGFVPVEELTPPGEKT
jgi:hypothetical protein